MAVIDSSASGSVFSPSVGEVPDTGGTFATASVLGLDTPFQGTVTSGTDITDAFRITANSAGILQIDLTGLGQNVSVLIYSASQRFVTAVYGGEAEGSLQANFQAEAGASYYIFVSIGSGTTAYNLNAGYSPFSGSDADDNFTGTLRGEMMAGYGGADTLNGLAGDDRLFGGDGDDALYGGAATTAFRVRPVGTSCMAAPGSTSFMPGPRAIPCTGATTTISSMAATATTA
ncbi:MAG: hypothetical protein HZT43_11095 [Exiguobacterium profundum]|nr:MAG: hypothetical protein HZT43_11095 [Exiguobacterium profundum]